MMTHTPKPTDILGYLIGTLDKSIELEKQNAELLEALKYIAEAKNILLDPYNGLYFRDLVNKAKQAIAKAEGGE